MIWRSSILKPVIQSWLQNERILIWDFLGFIPARIWGGGAPTLTGGGKRIRPPGGGTPGGGPRKGSEPSKGGLPYGVDPVGGLEPR